MLLKALKESGFQKFGQVFGYAVGEVIDQVIDQVNSGWGQVIVSASDAPAYRDRDPRPGSFHFD
ncbi:MAG: hypothetical protein NDI61_02100 [Bdellovibrionaceae bacterium]|nr:hypothetical protein [Pseudobdellovibrionaceae bacterium]